MTLGNPLNSDQQRRIIAATLRLLEKPAPVEHLSLPEELP
jgi:hypothetical protein